MAPLSRRWSRSNRGQVDIAMIAPQSSAPGKGAMTLRQAMTSTATMARCLLYRKIYRSCPHSSL